MASTFDRGKQQNRSADSALQSNGSGQITLSDGSRWRIFDLRSSYKPAQIDPDLECALGCSRPQPARNDEAGPNRLYAVFRKDGTPLIAQDQLRKATRNLLDEVVAPPACGPLLRQLDATLGTWSQPPKPPSWLQLIVLPPCDENGVLEAWAREHGYAVLDRPARSDLLSREAPEPADLAGSGVLVIPRLEAWFLRHQRRRAHADVHSAFLSGPAA